MTTDAWAGELVTDLRPPGGAPLVPLRDWPEEVGEAPWIDADPASAVADARARQECALMCVRGFTAGSEERLRGLRRELEACRAAISEGHRVLPAQRRRASALRRLAILRQAVGVVAVSLTSHELDRAAVAELADVDEGCRQLLERHSQLGTGAHRP